MLESIVLLIAGLGAGLITGLLSASAVIFAAPVLIIFLNISPYNAIGISLAVDVFASATASFVFYKNNNIHLKKSFLLLITAIVFVLIGSYISQFIPQHNLAWATGLGTIFVGITIYKRKTKLHMQLKTNNIYILLAGVYIGLFAGIIGAGGGLMILFVLVNLLRYKTHEAIGTSILIMIFIALFGSIAHYVYSPFKIYYMLLAAIGGIFGAYIAAIIANRMDEKRLTKAVGIILIILGAALFLNYLL